MVGSIRVITLASCLCVFALGVARADGPKPSPALESALERGHAKYLQGDLDGALEEYTRAIQIEPRFAGSYYGRAKVKREKSDFRGALSDFTRAIELDPRVKEFYVDRGALRLARDDVAGADTDFAKALEIDPRCAPAHLNRGEVKWARKDYAGAAADYTRAIASDPRYVRAYIARGDARDLQGDRTGALADYDRAIGLDPKSVSAYYNRGITKARGDDPEGAIRDFTRAIDLNPRYAIAYSNRGLAKKAMGDLDGALADYTRAIELDPRYTKAYFNRGIARVQSDDRAGAIRDFTRAIELDPLDSNAWLLRGIARQDSGDDDGALSDYAQAIALRPKSAALYGVRGVLRWNLRDFVAAAADLRRAVAFDPAYDQARFYLFLAEALGPDGEVVARQNLVRGAASRGSPIKRASWTETLERALEGAISVEDAEKAARSSPSAEQDARVREVLFYGAMIEWARGNETGAIAMLERSLDGLDAKANKFTERRSAQAVLRWPRKPVASAAPSASASPAAPAPPTPRPDPSFSWTIPQGWTTSEPTSSMRLAQFDVGKDESGAPVQCALFANIAGSNDEFLDRWAGQMGPNAKTIDRSSETTRAGIVIARLEVRGAYTDSMHEGGAKTFDRATLLGAILRSSSGTLLVKLAGPSDVVDAQRGRFDDLIASMKPTSAAGPATSAVAEFLDGWAVVAGTETDAATGYPKRIRRTSDGAVMILIPAGTFQMGSVDTRSVMADESPRHAVTLSTAYYLDETEVTVGMWKRYAKDGGGAMPSSTDSFRPETTDAHPMHHVSWDDVQGYARWAHVRLPTEAEWERAARGGVDGLVYAWGSTDDPRRRNAGGDADGFVGLAPVKSFPPNAYGLFDMSGNAWEWVADRYAKDYYGRSPSRDPVGPTDSRTRVVRGGGPLSTADLRLSYRHVFLLPSYRDDSIGFRCARALPGAPSEEAGTSTLRGSHPPPASAPVPPPGSSDPRPPAGSAPPVAHDPVADAKAERLALTERLCDVYLEVRATHLLTEQRMKAVIGVTPFDVLGRTWADYEAGVAFLEGRSVVPVPLGDTLRALPKTRLTADWHRFLLESIRTELLHAEMDRADAMRIIDADLGSGSPRPGQESSARMAARLRALFGADPFVPLLKEVEARMEPGSGVPNPPFADPAYALYLRAKARVVGRLVAAFARDTDLVVARAPRASAAELHWIFQPNMASFENLGRRVLAELEENLKGAPVLAGDDRARADEARRELESAATLAANARAALQTIKGRIEALDRKIKADAAAQDDDDPDTLMPEFRGWSSDLANLEKRCREVAAALGAKLAPAR